LRTEPAGEAEEVEEVPQVGENQPGVISFPRAKPKAQALRERSERVGSATCEISYTNLQFLVFKIPDKLY